MSQHTAPGTSERDGHAGHAPARQNKNPAWGQTEQRGTAQVALPQPTPQATTANTATDEASPEAGRLVSHGTTAPAEPARHTSRMKRQCVIQQAAKQSGPAERTGGRNPSTDCS